MNETSIIPALFSESLVKYWKCTDFWATENDFRQIYYGYLIKTQHTIMTYHFLSEPRLCTIFRKCKKDTNHARQLKSNRNNEIRNKNRELSRRLTHANPC